MAHLPIEHYGVIGDMRTIALVGLNGSIDWCCYPHFDSPSVFGALLDDARGGRFRIAPARDRVTAKQLYFPDTNVLITRFLTPEGVGELTDFMPVEPAAAGSPDGLHRLIRRLTVLNWVVEHWQEPDEGIWEVRSGRRHFVYSRMMCWVALDRGLRLADKRSFPADRALWLRVRDEIYEEIMAKGWSPARRAFVQAYGSGTLDASNLLMSLVFFVSPTDPRMLATLQELVSDSLVYRYDMAAATDGLPGEEGTFSMCTFWLVEALTRAGRVDEARLIFEKMLTYANHVGLYAEEIGPHGEALGNFPQAFTHLALISAAFNLDRALGASR